MKKIYVWETLNLDTYYKDGIIVVLASNLKEARAIGVKNIYEGRKRAIKEFLKTKPIVYKFDTKTSKTLCYHSGSD